MLENKFKKDSEKLLHSVIDMFYQETNLKIIDVKTEFVNYLYERRLELSNSQKDMNQVKSAKSFIQSLNGTMVLPADINDRPYILISNKAINNNQFISTAIHELTHIHDFYDFSSYFNCNSFDNVEVHIDFPVLYQWSEYHARRMGYYFYRKITYLNRKDISLKEQINHIKNYECSFQLNYLREDLIKYKNDPTLYIYSIMQFLGRFSVWQDLFPNSININQLPKELMIAFGERIVNLYEYLYSNKTFDDIKDKFSDLDILLRKFVTEV